LPKTKKNSPRAKKRTCPVVWRVFEIFQGIEHGA
jgi:hypothetical protein